MRFRSLPQVNLPGAAIAAPPTMYPTEPVLPIPPDDGNFGDYDGDATVTIADSAAVLEVTMPSVMRKLEEVFASQLVDRIAFRFYNNRENSFGDTITVMNPAEFVSVQNKQTETVTAVPIFYDSKGQVIASDLDTTHFLAVHKGLTEVFMITTEDSVASFGKVDDAHWYGWSHRAWAEFTPDSVVKDGDVVQNAGYEPGFQPKTVEDLKTLAMVYADEVG